jgi:hypothetical protein
MLLRFLWTSHTFGLNTVASRDHPLALRAERKPKRS